MVDVATDNKIHYFTKTVAYIVGGRRYIGDPLGFVLTRDQPWVAVKASDLRDFKIANKKALIEGTMVETEEPSVDWETTNSYTDEQIDALLKKGIKEVRKVLPNISAVPTVVRILERAKDQRRSKEMLDLVEEYLEEIDHERIEIEDIDRKLDA